MQIAHFALIALLLSAPLASAEGERAGDFDYYVLSLSWSPNWCALEGDARGSAQCDPAKDFGWLVHGLWPQNERGYPSYCRLAQRDPSRGQTTAMADVMGDGGAAWYQWKKHGRCAGLTADAYFTTVRRALTAVTLPPVFTQLGKSYRLPASVVEEAFLQSNPTMTADMVTITCTQGRIQEARICLTKDLQPRACGRDALRDCRMEDALMDAVR